MSAATAKPRPARISPRCSTNRFGKSDALEGSVVKGIVVAIEKDMAVIDVGLKTEGRVALKRIRRPRPRRRASRSATRSRSISSASRTRSARP